MGQSSMSVVHDFHERLDFSEQAGHEAFWDAVYRKAFPSLVMHQSVIGDSACQRAGIDRVILLSNNKSLYIDEKKREREYNDILLEYISADTINSPGWIEKDLAIDYLAYAFMQSQRCYLFSWPLLRRAWQNFKPVWIKRYPRIEAQNHGYKTISVAVPIEVLRRAVSTAAVIQL